MRLARRLAVGLLVLTAVLQAPVTAQADNTITLPAGSFAVRATVQSKDAGNHLEFGLFRGPGTFDPTCGDGIPDCAPGDKKTYSGLSGSITFYLKDHNSNCGLEAFFSTDAVSAHVMQVSGGEWTIRWDDGGAPSQGDPPCIRDGDFDDLVVDIRTVADLSISKADTGTADTGTGLGPDPVRTGQVVRYRVSVANVGPGDATNVSMTDSPSAGAQIVGISGTGWTCPSSFPTASATCTRAGLPNGQTAPEIIVLVQAPSTPGTISNTGTVDATEDDPIATNDSATEPTEVTTAGTKDTATGFCAGGATTCSITTDTGTGATRSDPTVSTITIPGGSGAAAQIITMNELASPPTFCGGSKCAGQVLQFDSDASQTFLGVTDPNHPAQVMMIFDKSVKGGSQIYVQKGTAAPKLVAQCTTPGIASPHPCVSEKNILLPNGDREFIVLFLQGDPTIGKR
jgi:uncharacterized repeat protein (TIGR01451 family)